MLWALDETLRFMQPHVPCHLISAQTLSQVKQMAAMLPEAGSSYYWECRLGASAAQVDFLTCIMASDQGRETLLGQGTDAGLPHILLENPVWRRTRDFFEQWNEPTSMLYEAIPLVWLEFDQVNGPVPNIPLPSLSFCLDPLYADRRSWAQYVNARDPRKRYQVAEKGLPLLFGGPLSPQKKKALLVCFDSLPAGGRIIHISAMVARQPAVMKVYGVVPKGQLLTYLARIGWPGSVPELTDILTTFCTPETVDHNMYVDLSIGETVLPRLGVAFAQQQIENLSDRDPKRRRLLELCVQAELCTSEKRDALLTWPGNSRTVFRDRGSTRLRKWLDVKIVYQPDHPLEAKAYLGFMPYSSFL